MRAYDRQFTKRAVNVDTTRDLVETQDLWRPVEGPQGVPPFWSAFSEAYEEAAAASARGGQLQSLLRLTRCPGLGVVRSYRCGREATQIQAWCDAPYCPACGHERAASAARSLRETWTDARLLVVNIPMGVTGRLSLPQATSVAAVRDAWSRVTARIHSRTGLPRLQPLPRLVVHPGGITQFVQIPGAPASDDVATRLLIDEVKVACKRIGLRDVRAEALSTEKAIERFLAVIAMEATCFRAGVAGDLERLDGLDWRTSFPGDATRDAALKACARRWVQLVKDRHRESRRKLCLGASGSLPAPEKPAKGGTAACPTHGNTCQPVSVKVRSWTASSAPLWQGPPDSLSASPTRTQIGAFFDRISRARARKAS